MVRIFFALFALFATLYATEIVSYETDPSKIQFLQKDKNDHFYLNITTLKKKLSADNKALLFATNGGMYLRDFSAQGLYVQDGKRVSEMNTKHENYGNFYMNPNGIFYITYEAAAFIVPREIYARQSPRSIKYATQSGPMLVIGGKINRLFRPKSTSYYIRNGVGVLPSGMLVFAISKEPINFYNFARYFQKRGCRNALYLDGYVSQMYTKKDGFVNLGHSASIFIVETSNIKTGSAPSN